ncbi:MULTISPECIES: enoyl-CoA hydratase/isomerase family protein [unclassified Sphingobium]|uniref:enoyl-CoA hydratase/isomerase family protein n=1 Tax=unclassified Sphingobium TaxID=2611147 RepID=UPI000D16E726|nr:MULTISPECIES: enoyl-CoA hydratase-related protein [unclassified Sphingobium]MBG6120084.1 2-(1,2-epoxy-1,2-dihydrophenyl)acetyl-CoA isomerase [Sphingobium sp. JAI105]PSO12867.1 enoyl-CoA hydratase [Sphingobium sp. AEW4]TWD05715.1 2-(1,2-epoxy-1,2-dihydrophenyl)acetyl-CoA isomerase [Sphingobium sp. AEW010]TWD23268.1 2-(1,2-epoxy-1,2-dihydrophenyl)acetyl-CoA isomerase [Sphingobium sp. AEW013]TWD25128.1 2-(1,2-epoxy-1,2-dihydrophenyl)acetyl-CoA isomerase [Sphingobium sp. AEW001]
MSIHYNVADGIARMVIDRPERKGALDADMRVAMVEYVEAAAVDDAVRVLVIEGTQGNFCSGADLGQFSGETIASSRQRMRRGGLRLARAIWEMEKPVVASVGGPAIGLGWAIALVCDQIVVARSARFAFTQANISLVPDCGAAYMLVRHLGLLRAKSLLFSGRMVGAQEAFDLGLASDLVDDDALADHVAALAQRLAAGPTFALGMTKHLLHQALGPSLADFLELETMIAPQLRFTEDFKEGTSAFREKRKPQFKGY